MKDGYNTGTVSMKGCTGAVAKLDFKTIAASCNDKTTVIEQVI